LDREDVSALRQSGSFCIVTERVCFVLRQRGFVCIKWEGLFSFRQKGVSALIQRVCVCIKTEMVCVH